MGEVVAIEVPLQQDLKAFSQYLWQQRVSHRILADKDRQLLLVGNQSVALQVREAYQKIQAGHEPSPEIAMPTATQPVLVMLRLFSLLPVTLGLIVLSLLGFLLVYFDRDFSWVKHLTFFDFEQVGAYLNLTIPEGQYWRLITPIFLHFGLMHIAFNMAILWFVGQRVELLQGSVRMLGITMVIGLASNVMQARYVDAALFGGMSGVVYGLLGYGWIWSLLRPEKSLHIPTALVYFSLFMLVVGFAGLASMLGAGKTANVAHLGGLVMGCLIGLGAALIDKYSSQ